MSVNRKVTVPDGKFFVDSLRMCLRARWSTVPRYGIGPDESMVCTPGIRPQMLTSM
jgi:hypothetical protein